MASADVVTLHAPPSGPAVGEQPMLKARGLSVTVAEASSMPPSQPCVSRL
jgi:hypothetical protein